MPLSLLLTCLYLGFFSPNSNSLGCTHLQACCHCCQRCFLCELEHGTESSWLFHISNWGSCSFLNLCNLPLKRQGSWEELLSGGIHAGREGFLSFPATIPTNSSFSSILPRKWMKIVRSVQEFDKWEFLLVLNMLVCPKHIWIWIFMHKYTNACVHLLCRKQHLGDRGVGTR